MQLVYGGAGYNGPLSDVWVFNPLQRSWSRPTIRGAHPAAREMHTGLMLDDTRMLVYGGRGANNKWVGAAWCRVVLRGCVWCKPPHLAQATSDVKIPVTTHWL